MHHRHPLTLAAALLLALAMAGCGTTPPTPDPAPAAPTSAPAPSPAPPAEPTAEPSPAAVAPTAEVPPEPTAAPTEAAADEAPPLDRTLGLQDPRLEGDDVRAAQQRLLDLGYTQLGEADGIFGPDTEAAVRAFQADSGLDADGVIGPQTWGALFGGQGAEAPPVPIVYALSGGAGYLLGGSRGGAWVDPATTAAPLAGGETYRRYGAAGPSGTATGTRPESAGVPCEETLLLQLTPATEGDVVALGGDWEPQPRSAEDVMAESDQYADAVAALLVSEGIASPEVQIRQALRVDLQGDGTEEVLLVATRLAEPRSTVAAGDYSLVALSQPDNPARVVKLVGESHTEAVEFAAPLEYRIAGLLDLNGDGALDMLVEWDYYEGGGMQVFDTAGPMPRPALEVGCGA